MLTSKVKAGQTVVKSMTFEELKLRGTHLVVAICCVGLSCYFYFFELCVLTLTPLDNVCFLDLTEAFSVTITVVASATTIFVAPVICFHGWGFVSPGLIVRERLSWGWRLSAIPLWLLVSLLAAQGAAKNLCVWFLGYSIAEGGLVLQYLPLMSGFVWFKLKCFVCVAGCLAGLQAFANQIEGLASLPAKRRWLYSGAVLLGAFLAAGAPQLIFSLCILFMCELWFLSEYVKAHCF